MAPLGWTRLFFDNLAAVEVAIHKQRRLASRERKLPEFVGRCFLRSLHEPERERLGSLLSTHDS